MYFNAAVHTGVRELEFSSCCEQAFRVRLRYGVRYGEGAIATSSDDDPRSSDRPLASNRWSRPMNVVHGQEIVFPPALDTASSNVASSDVVMSSVRTSERPYNTDVIDLTHHMLSARHLLTTTG